MKWMICTFMLFFALGLMAQEATQPSQPENTPKASSEQQPSQIPDADNADLNDPAVTMTVTVDSVTLPEHVCPLRCNEVAYSIAQSNEAIDVSTGVLGQN
jgi:hypothetical protein